MHMRALSSGCDCRLGLSNCHHHKGISTRATHIILDEFPSRIKDGEAAKRIAAQRDTLHVRPAAAEPIDRHFALQVSAIRIR